MIEAEMSTTKVNCINCDHENSVQDKAFEELQFVKCENCQSEFNLFGVYRSLYETIPLCKTMVDVAVDHTYAKYYVEASNPTEKTAIEQNLEYNHFQENLRRILHDQILFGNCFLQMIHEDSGLVLQHLEPTELEFAFDFVQEPPFKGFSLEIVEMKRHSTPFTVYEMNSILLFRGGLASVKPIGYSIFGFDFTTWYFLRDVTNKYPLLDMQKEKHKDLKELREFEESIALEAAGIPHHLIFSWMQINPYVIKIENNRFQYDIESRRSTISRRMERKLFPAILKRNYEYNNFPRLMWQTV